ncbi:hypothetical protein GQ53DRAFT_754033 [Thozetella sp. PMI_491]|nr:hypothetical protein GQ53DRAFT_754033 [Thozetella sp. PMI_491]
MSQTYSASSYSYSYSSSSISSSATNQNGKVSGSRHSEHVVSNPSGTTVRTVSQTLGDPPVEQVRRFDNRGREVLGGPTDDASRRIEDVTEDKEAHRDHK